MTTIEDGFLFGMPARIIKVDPGNIVLCDSCNEDYTESEESGGILFRSYAYCPKCAKRAEKSAKKYGEEHYIRARCPSNKSFANWVREDLR